MNPWTALLKSVSHSADGYTAKPAAALVLTDSGIADRPHVRLVPIVAIEFTATPPGALGGN